jgi:hypothetical protein
MDPLLTPPRNFREIIEADLRRAARLVVQVQDEIDWQLRMETPEGDYHLAVTMPNDNHERASMMRRLETFMQWKRASAFCLAVETYEPDALYAVGISKHERANCLARIRREPKPWTSANFGAIEWLPESSIDPSLTALLPIPARPLTPKEVSALEKWFGVSGKFPAVHVPTASIRGL